MGVSNRPRSATIVPLATSLGKCTRDLRLLASPGYAALTLPPRQAGSSQMPGKVNPVVLEAAGQVAIRAQASQQTINAAIMAGDLQINHYLPLVADELLTMLEQLAACCTSLAEGCIAGISADADSGRQQLRSSTAALTLLATRLGYATAADLATNAATQDTTAVDLAIDRGLLTADQWEAMSSPAALNRLGSADLVLGALCPLQR